jgi:DNA-binding transcriptional ArsR family regulator
MRAEQLVLIAKALADPTRLRILRKLRAVGEMTCNDVCSLCDQSQPTVSHHIRTLADAGVISIRKQGPYHILTPDDDVLREFSRSIAGPAIAAATPDAPRTKPRPRRKTAHKPGA